MWNKEAVDFGGLLDLQGKQGRKEPKGDISFFTIPFRLSTRCFFY